MKGHRYAHGLFDGCDSWNVQALVLDSLDHAFQHATCRPDRRREQILGFRNKLSRVLRLRQ